jgi:EAL domain-containing protein (putative c-di-GMP-specific phosphodiesterase class I)
MPWNQRLVPAKKGMGIDFVQGYAIGRPEPLRKAALQAA